MMVMSRISCSSTRSPGKVLALAAGAAEPPIIIAGGLFSGMKIYTRTGDDGETGLFGGGRVPKDHPRVAAYGDVDELSSTIGVARATEPVGFFDRLLESVQRDLFAIGGQLATPDPAKVAKALEKADLSEARVAEF